MTSWELVYCERLQEDLQVGNSSYLDLDFVVGLARRQSQLLRSEGWLERQTTNQDPSPSLCFCSCPNQVLGGGPGEVKTWSQAEVGIEQPLSLDIRTPQPL